MKTLISIALVAAGMLACAGNAAERKTEENYLDRMVMLDGALSKGTGFIGMFRDRKYVISNQEVFFRTGSVKLLDLQGEEIKYGKVLVPDDGRGIVFFEIDDADRRPSIPIQENVSEAVPLDSKINAYGTDNSSKVVIKSDGKLFGMGVESVQVSVKSKYRQEINGGPIISGDGKAIAVSTRPLEKIMTCIRLDTIKDLKELDMEKFLADSKALTDFEAACGRQKAVFDGISSELNAFSSKIGTASSPTVAQKVEILKKVEKASSAFDANAAELQKGPRGRKWSLEYFEKAYGTLAAQLSALNQEYGKLGDSAKKMEKKFNSWLIRKSEASNSKF